MQHRRTKGKWAKSEFLYCAQSRSQIMQAQMWFHFSWFVRTICSLFQEFRAFYNAAQCSLAKSKVKVNCCSQFGIECTVITLFLIVFAIVAFLKKLPRSFYFQNFFFFQNLDLGVCFLLFVSFLKVINVFMQCNTGFLKCGAFLTAVVLHTYIWSLKSWGVFFFPSEMKRQMKAEKKAGPQDASGDEETLDPNVRFLFIFSLLGFDGIS